MNRLSILEHAQKYAAMMDQHSHNHCVMFLSTKLNEMEGLQDKVKDDPDPEISTLFDASIKEHNETLELLQKHKEARSNSE